MAKPKIFLADDSAGDGTLLRLALTDAGIDAQVDQVFDGASAWEVLEMGSQMQPFPYALIILDLHLPKLSGLDLLQRLHGLTTLAGIPRVVMTASTHQKDQERALARHASQYLIKPFDYPGMIAMVRNLAPLLDPSARPAGHSGEKPSGRVPAHGSGSNSASGRNRAAR